MVPRHHVDSAAAAAEDTTSGSDADKGQRGGNARKDRVKFPASDHDVIKKISMCASDESAAALAHYTLINQQNKASHGDGKESNSAAAIVVSSRSTCASEGSSAVVVSAEEDSFGRVDSGGVSTVG